MLTKTDLSQLRKIVREEVENESSSVRDDLTAEIKLSRMELQKDLRNLAERVKKNTSIFLHLNELPSSKLAGILAESSFPCPTKAGRVNKVFENVKLEEL